MKRSFLMVCLFVVAAFFLNACEEGEYNDLECDESTYQAECLDGTHYMKCNLGSLIVVACGNGHICKRNETSGASCILAE